MHPGPFLRRLRQPIALPSRGASERLRCGSFELVLEAVRGGYVLMVHDGMEGRRTFLGLPAAGQLELRLKAPCYPCCVTPREALRLLPGARLRGYLQVPLVPTVVFCAEGGQESPVLELLPAGLHAEWRDPRGCVQRSHSPFLHRLAPPGEDAFAVVPVLLSNRGTVLQAPAEFDIALQDGELWECRGHVLAAPRRMAFATDGGVQQTTRQRSRAVVA